MGNKKNRTEEEFTRDYNSIVKESGNRMSGIKEPLNNSRHFKKFTVYTNDAKCITSYNL
jgi:hypothetical protein